MKEIWKDIVGFEGLYQVSNLEWCTHKYNINYGTGNERRKNTELKTKRGDNFVH